MAATERPELTMRLDMHLNGGSKFSEFHYAVLADGKETGIRRYKLTNGSPKYLVTADVFVRGEETFDVLATRVGLIEWLYAHIKDKEE